MKKRIALAASIVMAISVGGMLPASATKLAAPVVGTDACIRSGSQLIINESDGDITVAKSGSVLAITVDGVALATAYSGASCADSLSGVTTVQLAADDDSTVGEGNISFNLEAPANYLASFTGITFSVQAEGELFFDGHTLTGSGTEYRPITATVGEESFAVGSLSGSYYAGSLGFEGGKANDTFDASGVTTTDVVAHGGDGDDTLKGGAGHDQLFGGDGSDDGDDVLYGNGGDDELSVKDGATACNDPKSSNPKATKCTTAASGGADQAWGGAGDDMFEADAADTVAPGDGQDMFTSTTAVYQLNYSDSSAAVTVNLTVAPGVVKSTAGDDYFASIAVEQFVGSELADTMVGASGDDFLYGGSGADVIAGQAGADLLSGNGGADKIKGGTENDTVLGDTGADLINGGLGDDTINGGGGDDVMFGSAGDDTLFGGKGSDQAWGGKGSLDVCAAEVTDHCEFKK